MKHYPMIRLPDYETLWKIQKKRFGIWWTVRNYETMRSAERYIKEILNPTIKEFSK